MVHPCNKIFCIIKKNVENAYGPMIWANLSDTVSEKSRVENNMYNMLKFV